MIYNLFKRISDIIASFIVLILLSPLFIFISLWIILDSKGGAFYKQVRIGKNGKEFKLLKFRSMRPDSDKKSQITIGNDNRITKVGKFIRKYKIDEFPQLINIIKGDMSVVGPRPEVPKYVNMYNENQKKVLQVKPGLTDYASILYFDEQSVLGKSEDPEKTYINEVMPHKLELNLKYIQEKSFLTDLKIIFQTIGKIFK